MNVRKKENWWDEESERLVKRIIQVWKVLKQLIVEGCKYIWQYGSGYEWMEKEWDKFEIEWKEAEADWHFKGRWGELLVNEKQN
jgi:hypothetical protein